jgi:putative ATP-dependent endonuclease of OLD family
MRIRALTLSNFRCFGPAPVTINFGDLTAFIGANGAGKTAALQALSRLFGLMHAERRLVRADFHQAAADVDDPEELTLYVEARIEFPELQNAVAGAVPESFNQMIVEGPVQPPFCRVRLEGVWRSSNHPDGEIEETLSWLQNPDGDPTAADKVKMLSFDRARIQVLYVPAARDPMRHFRDIAGSLIYPLLRAVQWSEDTTDTVVDSAENVQTAFRGEAGVQQIETAIRDQWRALQEFPAYQNVQLQPLSARFEDLLRHVQALFSAGDDLRSQPLERLSEGLRSLFYFALVGARFGIEQSVRAAGGGQAEPTLVFEEGALPALTLFAIEEPENHLAPHYLGRILALLHQFSGLPNAQTVLSSQSPAILGRVAPENVRHFLVDKNTGIAGVRTIRLPQADQGEVYKYVKEAVRAYPELYFSSVVVLCEGDTEEIVVPRVAAAAALGLDTRFVSVVPLGGRHVNHLWRLLTDLAIPHVTLLDLDRERLGGGWGRIHYAINQLLMYRPSLRPRLLRDPQNGQHVLTDEELTQLAQRNVADDAGMTAWIQHLEAFDVYFSSPLDLDFLMLQAFPEQYHATAPAGGGPQIPIEEAALQQRVQRACRAVLKADGGEGDTYTGEEKQAFIWYSYLFLGRSKPSTHLLALNQLNDAALIGGTPAILSRLVQKIRQKLDPPPAVAVAAPPEPAGVTSAQPS